MVTTIRIEKACLLLFLLLTHPVYSSHVPPPCDATAANPCIVQDSAPANTLLASLRNSLMIKEYYHGNQIGIDNLRFSASGQPAEYVWPFLTDYIHSRSPKPIKQILIVDLRQESHVFHNGIPTSLADIHNWVNLGKSADEVLRIENSWLTQLASKSKTYNVLSVQQFDLKQYEQGRTVEVITVHDEASAVKKYGLKYLRFAVTDHRKPDDADIEAFVSLIDHLPETTWIHVHCHGGKGRSTTFLAMYDMLKNADNVSFDEIIARQAAIPPYYDLSQTVRSGPEMNVYYQQRYEFLKQFYQYALHKRMGLTLTWGEWNQAQLS